ncbi:cob(I)yrinic acid a,c-diamide adenosyltransferase [Clostridium sp. MSJ-8]|uniref:cob(I)yrinic acid a,c-diamide adenosyltransferase n=1 Tax=Clostridium sp. MSJ-8 TaxID=2841510 RepID=UPI001C0EE71F|nr:cob(I)yrinic acid a,c-diamide adenosyltransferase [Clostridium sp. MSJ-8]MBU5487624.1 cob(I)yrinic acid a,c-diamide adenosyltransferase [Clostridium sp. MSJ-8]
MKKDLGLIHIYCGDGKGKTTASIGIAIRGISCNYNVLFCQFLKSGESSEIKILKKYPNCNVEIGEGLRGFVYDLSKEELQKVKKNNDKTFDKIIELCNNGKCDILILDEIMSTINLELIDYNKVLNFLKNKPTNIEVIMTGRDPKDELIELADYVSEIKKIKHPFDKGVYARNGIDM